jgi:hypothetical protein
MRSTAVQMTTAPSCTLPPGCSAASSGCCCSSSTADAMLLPCWCWRCCLLAAAPRRALRALVPFWTPDSLQKANVRSAASDSCPQHCRSRCPPLSAALRHLAAGHQVVPVDAEVHACRRARCCAVRRRRRARWPGRLPPPLPTAAAWPRRRHLQARLTHGAAQPSPAPPAAAAAPPLLPSSSLAATTAARPQTRPASHRGSRVAHPARYSCVAAVDLRPAAPHLSRPPLLPSDPSAQQLGAAQIPRASAPSPAPCLPSAQSPMHRGPEVREGPARPPAAAHPSATPCCRPRDSADEPARLGPGRCPAPSSPRVVPWRIRS